MVNEPVVLLLRGIEKVNIRKSRKFCFRKKVFYKLYTERKVIAVHLFIVPNIAKHFPRIELPPLEHFGIKQGGTRLRLGEGNFKIKYRSFCR